MRGGREGGGREGGKREEGAEQGARGEGEEGGEREGGSHECVYARKSTSLAVCSRAGVISTVGVGRLCSSLVIFTECDGVVSARTTYVCVCVCLTFEVNKQQ